MPATVIPSDTTLDVPGEPDAAFPAEALPIDAIAARLLAKTRGARAETGVRVAEILLGRTADPAAVPADPCPTQSAIAQALDLTRARIGQLYGKLLAKAIKDPAVTSVRDQLVDWLDTQGGAATADELAALLAEPVRAVVNPATNGP